MNPTWRDIIFGLFPVVFLLLLYLQRRTKHKSRERATQHPSYPKPYKPIEPQFGGTDLLSKAASVGVKIHYIFAGGCGILILAGLVYGAVVDALTRIIVLSTFFVMALAFLIAKGLSKSARKQD
jgi:hypothetical protein